MLNEGRHAGAARFGGKVRPFYRSRSFWCGVPGLVFLLWAWWDSGGYASHVEWQRGSDLDRVWISSGAVGWRQAAKLDPVSGNLFTTERMGLGDVMSPTPRRKERQFEFNRAFDWMEPVRVDWPEVPGRQFMMAHRRVALWVIVAGYVVVWLGAVFAWRWRKARVMKGLTESIPEKEVAG